MKNLLLVIIVFLSLVSCGKKGDPVYEGAKLEIIDAKTKVVL